MTPLLLALLALVLLDVAVIAGWTPDSRDGRDWWWRQWPPTRRPVLVTASLAPRHGNVLSLRRDLDKAPPSGPRSSRPGAAPLVACVPQAGAGTTAHC